MPNLPLPRAIDLSAKGAIVTLDKPRFSGIMLRSKSHCSGLRTVLRSLGMSDVQSGVQQIRIRDEAGIFRVLYVAKLEDAVYVLHCFQKKTRRTAKSDLDLASKRYSELVKEQKR